MTSATISVRRTVRCDLPREREQERLNHGTAVEFNLVARTSEPTAQCLEAGLVKTEASAAGYSQQGRLELCSIACAQRSNQSDPVEKTGWHASSPAPDIGRGCPGDGCGLNLYIFCDDQAWLCSDFEKQTYCIVRDPSMHTAGARGAGAGAGAGGRRDRRNGRRQTSRHILLL